MKITNYIYLLSFASILIIGCNSKTDVNPEEDQVQDNTVSKFLIDVKSLESDTNTNPIVAFKDLAEEIAEDKMIVSKKNIKKVLLKSKENSNCVIVTGNHTIVKILNFDNCQQSGSWKACMPTVEGYIKKGKLNYKKDFMNNVIGKPDKQERVAYFFKNETMKEKKSDSYEQAPPLTYYENGKIKVSGYGYKKFYRYFVSAKDGIDLMESTDLNSKKIANIPNNTELWIESKDGKWLYIYTVFDLSPGDEGYYNDLIDPSELNGYVMNKLIETELDSINKPGVWTYFFESGDIEREEFHFTNFIKKIYYDKKGFITKIEERDGDENSPFGWGPDMVSNTFHKNGKIDCIHEGSGGGATSWCFDENGGKLFSYNYDPDNNPFILSKDIRDFYLIDTEKILNEIKTLRSSEYNDEEKIEINAAEEKNRITNEETGPKSPNYYICYSENNNKNLQLWIGFDEKAKATKVKYKGMSLDMDLVFVKEVDENEGGSYPVLAEYYNEIYEEKVNGIYKLTKSGNWYYAEYTRKSDSKVFNFTIDIGANNFSDGPCF
jgi:hypothetical protein